MSFFARHKAAVATAARAVDGFKQEWVSASLTERERERIAFEQLNWPIRLE
jgi:hypothetical protein